MSHRRKLVDRAAALGHGITYDYTPRRPGVEPHSLRCECGWRWGGRYKREADRQRNAHAREVASGLTPEQGRRADAFDIKPRRHLSATQLSMLETCGERYRFRYVEGLKIPPGAFLHAGRGTHKAVEEDLRAKLATGELLDDEAIPDIAAQAVRASIEESGLQLDEQHPTAEDARGFAVDRAVRLAGLHHAEVAPEIEPTHLERRITVELPGFPFDLVAILDIQDAQGIRDTKTAGKSKTQAEADGSEQLTIYAAAHLAAEGALPERLALDVLVDTKKPKPQTLITTRTEADVEVQLRRLERAAQVIEAGAYVPAAPDSWACSERWCGYWKLCPFARRPTSVAVNKQP